MLAAVWPTVLAWPRPQTDWPRLALRARGRKPGAASRVQDTRRAPRSRGADTRRVRGGARRPGVARRGGGENVVTPVSPRGEECRGEDGAGRSASRSFRRATWRASTAGIRGGQRCRLGTMNKNTICLWYDHDAEEAARFYARTFPDSEVGAVLRAPSDYPAGRAGDLLTRRLHGLRRPVHWPERRNRAPAQRGVLVPDSDRRSGRDRQVLARHRRQRRRGKPVRLVQGQMGPVLADHAAGADRRARPRRRRCQARVRRDDDDGQDRRRRDRGRREGEPVTA
jgi:hypothetical protein